MGRPTRVGPKMFHWFSLPATSPERIHGCFPRGRSGRLGDCPLAREVDLMRGRKNVPESWMEGAVSKLREYGLRHGVAGTEDCGRVVPRWVPSRESERVRKVQGIGVGIGKALKDTEAQYSV